MKKEERSALGKRIGEMLRQAMDNKTESLGRPYTTIDLEEDSGPDSTYATKVMTQKQPTIPSPVIVKAWAHALRPYLDEDEALVACGYFPDWAQRLIEERGCRWFVGRLKGEN